VHIHIHIVCLYVYDAFVYLFFISSQFIKQRVYHSCVKKTYDLRIINEFINFIFSSILFEKMILFFFFVEKIAKI
jgi:hypothetical protein